MSSYQQIRNECCEANRTLLAGRLVDLTFGNVSILDREKGIFAIKPSGVEYSELTPEAMVLVDLEGKVVEGKLRPSSDTPTHRRLFQEFRGIKSIVHTHSRNATAFAQAGRAIPCLGTTHADHFNGEIPVTRPMTRDEIQGGNYELETGKVIVERFMKLNPVEIPAVLLYGHGPFAWGISGNQAVENAIALEIVAEMAIKTLQINPHATPISSELLDKHFRRKHGANAYYGQK